MIGFDMNRPILPHAPPPPLLAGSDGQTALANPQAVSNKANDCCAYKILPGYFNHDKFNSCFTASAFRLKAFLLKALR